MNKNELIYKKIQYGSIPTDEDLLYFCRNNHILYHILCITVGNKEKNYTYNDFARIALFYLSKNYENLQKDFIQYMRQDTRPISFALKDLLNNDFNQQP